MAKTGECNAHNQLKKSIAHLLYSRSLVMTIHKRNIKADLIGAKQVPKTRTVFFLIEKMPKIHNKLI
jgi:hypothetical protein